MLVSPENSHWLAGKSPFCIGNTSSNGWFSIVMLVSRGVKYDHFRSFFVGGATLKLYTHLFYGVRVGCCLQLLLAGL